MAEPTRSDAYAPSSTDVNSTRARLDTLVHAADPRTILNSAIAVAKKQVFTQPLNKGQVAMLTDHAVKSRTKWVLLWAAFVDLSGAVLLAGAYPLMCANAPGTTPMFPVPGAFPASDFAFASVGNATGPPALDYAMTINLIAVSNAFGAVFSNYLSGVASDKFGRKPVILSCLLGGVLSYILMLVSGILYPNYWFFLAANFVNGLFSGIRGVISAYLQDIHEPMEFLKEVMPTMINFFLFGAMGGSILGMVWIAVANSDVANANSAFALFGPCMVGILLSTCMAITVQVYCPEPAKKEAPTGGEPPPPPPPMSKTAKTVLTLILLAGSLDTFGDYGNRFARNTILTNRYPLGRQPVVNYVLMASNIVSIFIAQKLVVAKSGPIAKLGFMKAAGTWCVLGNLASALVQFGLLTIIVVDTSMSGMGAFVAVWLISQVLGFASTIAAFMLWPAFVPKHKKGAFNGLRNSLTSVVNCVTPVMLSLIYQTGSLAPTDKQAATDRAGVTCLAVCGTISTLAFLLYLPMPGVLPKPPKPAGAPTEPVLKKAKTFVLPEPAIPLPIEHYDHVQWAEWSALPVAVRTKIQQARMKAGMPMVKLEWGTWHDDRPISGDIIASAPGEFKQFLEQQTKALTDNTQLQFIVDMRAKTAKELSEDPAKQAARDAKRAEMGRWLADYLDDAGYDMWDAVPYLFKAMMINAFPPIDALDEKAAEFKDVDEMRTGLLKIMRVFDQHVKAAELTNLLVTDLENASEVAKVKLD